MSQEKESVKLLPPIPQEAWHWDAVPKATPRDRSAIIRAYNKIEIATRREQVFFLKNLFRSEAMMIPTIAELSQFFGYSGSWAESMLRSYQKFQNSEKELKRGRPPITDSEDEKSLLLFISKCYSEENPPSVSQVNALLEARVRNVDRHWVKNFIERHATEVTQATATFIEEARHEVSRPSLEEYFKAVEIALRGVDPRFVFNVDETRVLVKNPSPKLDVIIPALASDQHLTISAAKMEQTYLWWVASLYQGHALLLTLFQRVPLITPFRGK
jgi:hypothetical protein